MVRLLAVAVVSVFVGAAAAQEFISTKPLVIDRGGNRAGDSVVVQELGIEPGTIPGEARRGVAREFQNVLVSDVALQEFGVEPAYPNPAVYRRMMMFRDPTQPQPVVLHPDLPADAKEIVGSFDTDVATIRKKVEEAIQERRLRLIEELQKAQDRYTREAKLDEAVAIRDTIRKLKSAHLNVRPYPGSLYEFRQFEGQTLYFEVTGRIGGSVWGSDVYTGDSDLATAAVHAGAVTVGQTAVVEVQILPSQPQYVAMTRNGVSSSGWGSYPFSYTVKRWAPNQIGVTR